MAALAIVATVMLAHPEQGDRASLAASFAERSAAGQVAEQTVAEQTVAGPIVTPTPIRPMITAKRPAPPKVIRQPKPGRANLSRSTGVLQVVPGSDRAAGPGRTMTYRVEIEQGLTFGGQGLATVIHRTLTDRRGWQPIKQIRFQRIAGDNPDFRIIIATPDLTDQLCRPLVTGGELSCRVEDRVVLNAKRWAYAVPAYEGALGDYRSYLVNHEVGHALGYGHSQCPQPGTAAPVMMQQTKGLQGCRPNPWPSVNPT